MPKKTYEQIVAESSLENQVEDLLQWRREEKEKLAEIAELRRKQAILLRIPRVANALGEITRKTGEEKRKEEEEKKKKRGEKEEEEPEGAGGAANPRPPRIPKRKRGEGPGGAGGRGGARKRLEKNLEEVGKPAEAPVTWPPKSPPRD